jgi:hypothetical protein
VSPYAALAANFDIYRRFRHAVRHVYTFSLEPERVRQLATAVPDCHRRLDADLQAFVRFLEAIPHPDEGANGG